MTSSLPETLVRFRRELEDAIGREQVARAHASVRRRRLVVLIAALLVLVVGAAAAYGTVRHFFERPKGSTFDSPVWSPDGRRIYALSYRWDDGAATPEVYVMNADGSGVRNLTREWGPDVDPMWTSPVWSPNGKRLLFEHRRAGGFVTGLGATGQRDVYTMNGDGTGQRRLARGITRISLRNGQTTTPGLNPSPTWSPDGRRIAFVSNRDGWRCPIAIAPVRHAKCDSEIYVMNADGSRQRQLTRTQGFDTNPVWSPDGRAIAFVRAVRTGQEIYVLNADGSAQRNLTAGPGGGSAPAWSPDGRKIAFRSDRDGNGELYVINADGSGLRRLTRNSGEQHGGPVWSPDGRKIFFVHASHGGSDVWVMNADGSGQRNLTPDVKPPRHRYNSSPVSSRDGRKIAFVRQEDGTQQIYVMNADGSDQRRLTPSSG